MASFVDSEQDAPNSVFVSRDDGSDNDGDGFFQNRTLHRAVIMATLAATPAARNDK